MADYKAFQVIVDSVAIPKALFKIGETANGDVLYETEGVLYTQGDIVLEENITPPIRERIDNGELDELLEEVDREEAEALLGTPDRGLFVPEHAVEKQALEDYGHRTVSREDAVLLRSEGAEDARAAQEELLADGASERPQIREQDDTTGDASAEEALEQEARVLPSGVQATNPFKAKKGRTRSTADDSSNEEKETAAQRKKRESAEKKAAEEQKSNSDENNQ